MRLCLLTGLLTCLLFSLQNAGCAANRPNVIVIFTDDHGYSDLACQGIQSDLKTPHIDELAAGGVRMASGYVTAPQCVPSRAGLLSGRYQNRFGVESNGLPLDGFNAQATIAERLKKAGYATGMTGKWHLGTPQQIVRHGFDDVYYKNANRPGWANFGLDGTDREPGVERSGLYHLDANSEAACAFIKRHHDEPFFFYCAYRAPHVPLDAPPKYLKRFPGEMPERRRQALAMISAMDDGVGRMLETLREYDIEEQTLIFFIGDNGAPLKIHKLDAPGGGPGWDGSLNEPLNGEKGMLSEGGIRVPFLAYWKGTLPAGREYNHPVISLDVAATAAALAGLPADETLDGTNVIPYLTGVEDGVPHDTLFWRWIAQSAVREGKWKYLRGGAREYLFDLESDVEEKQDLAKAHPEIVKRLRAKLESWASELSPPGIQTKAMSETWEQYFDFYLDGKPAPPLREKSPAKAQSAELQGWIARNGGLSIVDGVLRVTPQKRGPSRPFLVRQQIGIAGPIDAEIELKNEHAGKVGIAWRTETQKDFSTDKTVTVNVPASGKLQKYSLKLPADGKIVHIRVLLPPGVSEVKRIRLAGKTQRSVREWDFSKASK